MIIAAMLMACGAPPVLRDADLALTEIAPSPAPADVGALLATGGAVWSPAGTDTTPGCATEVLPPDAVTAPCEGACEGEVPAQCEVEPEPIDVEVPPPPTPLVSRLAADVVGGVYPLVVSFDAAASELGSGDVTFTWSFGDGVESTDADDAAHTYIGQGAFLATLTLTDAVTGEISVSDVQIDVTTPACPVAAEPVEWGTVQDEELVELSGIAESPTEPNVWWVQQDSGNSPDLTVIDSAGETVSTHVLDEDLQDFEDIEASVDPVTGVATLFLADIGDNGHDRDEVAVWIVAEPDPLLDSEIEPVRMALEYPDGPENAETLLVDPVTFDLYIVSKEYEGESNVYVKRAPHVGEGPFELEALGARSTLEIVATAGDVSPDGARIVVRDYTDTALLFFRDGYLPFEDAFDAEPCEIEIHSEEQGEAISFLSDGGLVTVSEGDGAPLYYIGL